MESIPAAVFGQKINEWYRHIKRLNVTDAEMLRNEIKSELDVMEEDEQVVLYFQLMDFRHEQMLEYVNPSQNEVNKAEYLRSVEGEGKKLTGITEYHSVPSPLQTPLLLPSNQRPSAPQSAPGLE